MNTQFITIDSAPYATFSDSDAANTARAEMAPAAAMLRDDDFFKGKSIAELAREQGVGPVKDIGIFAGGIPEDEDVDELLREIYRLREP
jgi:hypothetical protein